MHRAGDTDVGEAALFLELLQALQRARVRQDAFLQTDDEDDGVFESLGRVEGNQGHRLALLLRMRQRAVLAGLRHVGAAHQGDTLQKQR